MTFDRDRTGAWVDSLGDHPHAPIIRQVLAAHDQAVAEAAELHRQIATAVEQREAAEVRGQVAVEDAARLAAWIVAHPAGDPTEVLDLHDRSSQ